MYCKEKNIEFADFVKVLSPQKIWDSKSHICKLRKILGPQITNPLIATLAEGPQMLQIL
jgi:hypothetical protein